MLKIVPLKEALSLVLQRFGQERAKPELISLDEAQGRFLAEDVVSAEDVPAFDRSTVDGFAVRSADLRGCSDSIPAILEKSGESLMGQLSHTPLLAGFCVYVPTGGALPPEADAMVMLEHTEDLGGGQFAFYKPAAPGDNMINRGEDFTRGEAILEAGKRISPADIGTLAALGATQIPLAARPVVGIVSTGDELVPPGESLQPGQIRDVNSGMLKALVLQNNGLPVCKGIVWDDYDTLRDICQELIEQVDVLLLSGGTSVGEKDNMPRIMAELGEVLIHGIAVKPGKPTIVGEIAGKAVFGLPGNPVAAFFIFDYLVKPLLLGLQGGKPETLQSSARLSRAVSSNHGREEFVLVRLDGDVADPVPSKSGLISTVSRANGYIVIPRDQEGLAKGALVQVSRL